MNKTRQSVKKKNKLAATCGPTFRMDGEGNPTWTNECVNEETLNYTVISVKLAFLFKCTFCFLDCLV